MLFRFFRKKEKKQKQTIEESDLAKLENLLPFPVKILGENGTYIVQIKVDPPGKWINNLLLVEGNQVYFSHEPESSKIRFLADDLNIPLEYNKQVDSIWDLIQLLSYIYDNLRKIYNAEVNAKLYGSVEKIQNLFVELRKKRDVNLCAKIFLELEKIRNEDPERYETFRKKLLKECDKILQILNGGCIQKS